MPEALESLLWCAALATWLMMLVGLMREQLKPLAKLLVRLLEVASRHRAK